MRIYHSISGRQHPIRFSPASGLGEGLTTPHRTKPACLRNVTQGIGLGFYETIKVIKNGCIWLRIGTSGWLLWTR